MQQVLNPIFAMGHFWTKILPRTASFFFIFGVGESNNNHTLFASHVLLKIFFFSDMFYKWHQLALNLSPTPLVISVAIIRAPSQSDVTPTRGVSRTHYCRSTQLS